MSEKVWESEQWLLYWGFAYLSLFSPLSPPLLPPPKPPTLPASPPPSKCVLLYCHCARAFAQQCCAILQSVLAHPRPTEDRETLCVAPTLTLLFHPLAGKTQRWTTAMDAPPSKCASCWIGLFSHSQSHSVYVPIYPYSTGSGSRST